MWLLLAVVQTAAGSSADQSTLERMARGDGEALAELYDRHARLIYSLALRILRDQSDAEDVVQEVFSQAWRQAARYSAGRGNVVAWLLTLARSRAIDRLRARRVRPAPSTSEQALATIKDESPSVDVRLEWAGRAAQVRLALDALPLLQRVAIELAFYEGLTHAEIAERLEEPLGTVKTRIRQGLLKLRDQLAGAVS